MRVLTTADKLHTEQFTPIEQNAYANIEVGDGGLIAMFGGAGQGKSTMACRFADGIPGPAYYISAEEGVSRAVSARLLRANVKRKDFYIGPPGAVISIVEDAQNIGARSLIIDSLQVASWSPGDLRRVLSLVKSLSALIVTLQVNKRGLPAGENAILHEVDVTIHVDGMRWELEKSRYQDWRGVCGDVLPPAAMEASAP
jgi:predicted ATP-dependent serine protease